MSNQTVTIRIVRDVVTKMGLVFTAGTVHAAEYHPRSLISGFAAYYVAISDAGYRTAFPANYAERV